MRIALALLIAAVPAVAKERDGVVAPATIQVDGKPLQLLGMGLRKKLWVRVYLASLYLENPTEDAKQVIATDQIKRVQMNMLRDLDRGRSSRRCSRDSSATPVRGCRSCKNGWTGSSAPSPTCAAARRS
jgi:hypothetical protein